MRTIDYDTSGCTSRSTSCPTQITRRLSSSWAILTGALKIPFLQYLQLTRRVRRKDSVNQMSVSNLSIVFGPTLLGAPPHEGGLNLEHMSFQCKVSRSEID